MSCCKVSGAVVVIPVKLGDLVQAGDVLMVLTSMKMESPLTAPRDGEVVAIADYKVGDTVSHFSTLRNTVDVRS